MERLNTPDQRMPKLSICITTRNRKSLLTETLDHIFHKQNLPQSDYEVILVNDGGESLEDLIEIFSGFPLRVIMNRGIGVATGRNTGASMAKGDIILFLDSDILPTPDHLVRHLTLHQLHSDWMVTNHRLYPEGLMKKAEKSPFGRYKVQHEYQWEEGINKKIPVENYPGLYFTNLSAGFSFSMRKTTFDAVGGFSELFEYATCEDAEFLYQALKKGFKMVFDEENICYHNEWDNFTLKQWLSRQATGIKGSLVMVHLHPEGKSHATFYLNEPIFMHDSLHLKLRKLRRYALSNIVSRKIIRGAIFLSEKIHAPDAFLFRLYNAAWIGETHHSFLQDYNNLFGNQKSGKKL